MTTITSSKRVCGVILTYNPELYNLDKLLNQCSCDCELIIIVDNNSKNLLEIMNFFGKRCLLIPSKENVGVAAGYNKGLNLALAMGFDYVVLLDQDGDLPSGFLAHGIMRLIQKPSLAVVAPKMLNHGVLVKNVKVPILSGMLINMTSWKKLGKFNENLYTDFIDFEWCNRVLSAGYGIEFLDFNMRHQIGRPIYFFGVYSLHDPLRLGSMTADAIYLVKNGYTFWLIATLIKTIAKNLIFQPFNWLEILLHQYQALKISLSSRGGNTK